MKVIFTGLESAGKSYFLAAKARELVNRNATWHKRWGITRPIVSNLRFSTHFENKADEMHVPIRYWNRLQDIAGIEECDLLWDEIGTFLDARLWANLSLDVRRWLAQSAKVGVNMYGTAQDFAQIDLSFRRLVSNLYEVRKIAGSMRPSRTKPPAGTPWALFNVAELQAQPYDEQNKKVVDNFWWLFGWHVLDLKTIDVFDTRQRQEKSPPMPLEHVERVCKECGKVHIAHL